MHTGAEDILTVTFVTFLDQYSYRENTTFKPEREHIACG